MIAFSDGELSRANALGLLRTSTPIALPCSKISCESEDNTTLSKIFDLRISRSVISIKERPFILRKFFFNSF